MPDRIFYTKLYAFQDELLEIVRAQNVDFYLTGGTALSRAYLNHRYSDDLDLFVNQTTDFKEQVNRVVTAVRGNDLNPIAGVTSESFLRITVQKDQFSLKIDFVNDVKYHYGDFSSADFFHKIDSWRNILSNKLCAVSRSEPKDIADIFYIAKNFSFGWAEIFEEAKSKDLWVDPLAVSRIIRTFPLKSFDALKWVVPVEPKILADALQNMHEDIFNGRINSLAE